jgi:hypothetical protein
MVAMIKGLTFVLAGTAIVFVAAHFRPDVAAGQSGGSAPAGDRAKFVGTYELVVTEVKDASGKWSPTPNFNSNGYIIYADTGHMGVHIMPKVRARFAANPPTGEEALAALRGYTAYFGSFSVNDKERDKYVIHNRFGQINPGGAVEVRRYYDFVTMPNGSQRLILTPPPQMAAARTRRRAGWSGSACPMRLFLLKRRSSSGSTSCSTPTAIERRTARKCSTETRSRPAPGRRTSSTPHRAT